MPIPEITATAPGDAALVSRVLARAFDDDPMMRWFFPDGALRAGRLQAYFEVLFTRQYGPHGVCERTGAAAAFWVPDGARDKAVPDEETIRRLVDVLGERAPAFKDAVERAAGHTPREPHWYLAVIGADPASRGLGHGAALLRSGLARADAAGLPVYLESSKPGNVPLYEHFGFRVREELRLGPGGPPLWSMWREPRAGAEA
ncbi:MULTISPECIES: GNAT family N-acetyltransferase [unclassified Streptomyces]|uniref:GNAT family N-acetyltransferase n=1 Tax=unclassified Streptomyces TaxID=2593676 RepID=UPI0036FF8508